MKDFTLILAAVTVLCGIAWFWDFLKVRPLRNARILAAEKAAGGSLSKEEREKLEAGNWLLTSAASASGCSSRCSCSAPSSSSRSGSPRSQ